MKVCPTSANQFGFGCNRATVESTLFQRNRVLPGVTGYAVAPRHEKRTDAKRMGNHGAIPEEAIDNHAVGCGDDVVSALSDDELVRRAQADPDTFGLLYERYTRRFTPSSPRGSGATPTSRKI